MSERKDGGPAFPNITPDMPVDGGPGMSLRDYFAAKAMQGIVNALNGRGNEYSESVIAAESYKLADAMLKARGQNGETK